MTELFYQANPGFVKREIAGEVILVPVGATTQQFNGMIALSETAGVLWDALQTPVTEAALAELLCEQYEVDYDTALADTKEFLATGVSHHAISNA